MRGPAPKGIEMRLAELAVAAAPAPSASQRSGAKAAAFGRCTSSTLSRRITLLTVTPSGTGRDVQQRA
jgi:hypothetical protein